jgi:paraquat-inducible protein B
MSKKANPTLIGAFVVGAIALVIAGIVIFGSGELFKKRYEYVMFFDESVKGLMVGAPVSFKGVQVGSVTDVKLHFDTEQLSAQIPVFIEFTPESVTYIGQSEDEYGETEKLIELGLRAQLKSQSMLTGQLYIQLDFHPDKPTKLVGSIERCPEIPTIPSDLEELMKTIEDLPIQDLIDNANHMIESIDELVSSPELKGAVAGIEQTVTNANQLAKDADKLVRDINAHIDPLASGLEGTIDDTRKLVQKVDGHVDPLMAGIEETLADGRAALEKAEKAIANIENLTEEDSAVIYELITALEEITAMSRALRVAADYFERHPESLLSGKGE